MIVCGNKFFYLSNCTSIWIILSVVGGAFKLTANFQLSFWSKLFTSLNLLSLVCATVCWITFEISFWNYYILSIFNSLGSSSRLFCIMISCVAWLTLKFPFTNMELTLFSNNLISLSRMRDIITIICTRFLKFPLRHNFVIGEYYFTLSFYSLSRIVINICWKTFKFTT